MVEGAGAINRRLTSLASRVQKLEGAGKKKARRGGNMLGGAAVSGGAMRDIKSQIHLQKMQGIPKGQAKVFFGGANYSVMGTGWLSSLWDKVKSGVSAIASVAKPIIKDSGVISTLAEQIPGIGPLAANYARSRGYGRRRVK